MTRGLTRRRFLGVAGAALAACTRPARRRPEPVGAAPASLVFRGGGVLTVDAGLPRAEAVAVRDGGILAVGSDDEIEAFVGGATEVVDLTGRTLIPGFQDAHIHIQEASSPAWTCIVPGNRRPPELLPEIERCASRGAGRGEGWLLGWGFAIEQMLDHLDRDGAAPVDLLDEVVPDRPVVIMERTSHAAWVNSAALERAGISRATPDPPGGVIVRGADGRPNGLLLDTAGERAFDAALARTDELVDLQAEGLRWGLGQLARHGITSIADARVYRRRADLEVWRRADERGELTVRAVLGLWAYAEDDDDEQIAELASLYDPNPGGLVRTTQIKLYADGITLNGTAALVAPYEGSFLREIADLDVGSRRGLRPFDAERLARYTAALERTGFDVHVHAIGDGGVRAGLDAVEAAIRENGPDVDRRHRLTHLELVDPTDLSRFAELGVIADVQVSGDWALPEAWDSQRVYVGDRADRFIPLRELYEAGATVTLSSDWDVSTMDPLVGIQHALTRRPQALPNLEAALRAYTLTPAYALRQEDSTGSIEVGKLADLVVLDAELGSLPAQEIASASVERTYLAGREIFRSGGA